MRKIIKNRRSKYLVIASVVAVMTFSLFSHTIAEVHAHQTQQDMHSTPRGFSACASNTCCMAIPFNPSFFEPCIISTHLLTPPLEFDPNGDIDPPYKPPKV